MVFEAQLLSRPISGRCRSLRACLARVASLSGLGHARTAEFRHAQAAVRGDPIGAPGRWVAAFSCAVQGCSAAACGLPAGDGTWAGCCICMLGKRRRFHEARQQRTSCAALVGLLLLLANPRRPLPRVSLRPAEDSPARHTWDRTLSWTCVSISPHSQPAASHHKPATAPSCPATEPWTSRRRRRRRRTPPRSPRTAPRTAPPTPSPRAVAAAR
jgi:hypothetical protein